MRIDTEDIEPNVEAAINIAFYEYCMDYGLVKDRSRKEIYEPFRRGVIAGWRGRIQQEQVKAAKTVTCYCWSETCSQHHKPGDCVSKAEYTVETGPERIPVCGDCLTRNRTRHTKTTKLGIL